jgi:hypothetical protein
MIYTKDGRTYLAQDLPVKECYWCPGTVVLRDPLDGEVFSNAGHIQVSPDRTAITPHYEGCKSS